MGIDREQFTSTCGAAIMNLYDAGDEDNFYTRLMGFEQSCMEEADPMFFREPSVLTVVSADDKRC